MSASANDVKRRCFRPPHPGIAEAAELLSHAADAHLSGDAAEADRLIRAADMPEIAAWTKSIWGRVDPELHAFRKVPDAPPYLTDAARSRPRMPGAAARRAIETRDGLRCRFCETPVIRPQVRAILHARYPDAARWGGREAEQHAALQCLWLQYDHVAPHSRGGESSVDNVVITCAACNFGRGSWTVDEVGIEDPRLRDPAPAAGWDGLDRLLLAAPHPRSVTVAASPAERNEPVLEESVADALEAFEIELAELGVFADTTLKGNRMLRWRRADGRVFTLVAIMAGGALHFNYATESAAAAGRADLGHAYLRMLGAVASLNVRETRDGSQWYLRGRDDAETPRLEDLLCCSGGWVAVILGYVAALEGAVRGA